MKNGSLTIYGRKTQLFKKIRKFRNRESQNCQILHLKYLPQQEVVLSDCYLRFVAIARNLVPMSRYLFFFLFFFSFPQVKSRKQILKCLFCQFCFIFSFSPPIQSIYFFYGNFYYNSVTYSFHLLF